MKLPQCEIFFAPKISDEEILLAAGGRQPGKNYFLELAADRKVLAIDRGIEICRETNILPEFLIGDFDSAKKISLDWAAEKKIPIERHPADKDFTDTQLALKKIPATTSAIMTGAFGGRADQLYSNIFSCANSELKICLADEREIIFFLRGGESAEVKFFEKPSTVSLIPVSKICEDVTTKNLHWELADAKLFQDIPNATSNRIESSEIKIFLREGTLAIYFVFGENFL